MLHRGEIVVTQESDKSDIVVIHESDRSKTVVTQEPDGCQVGAERDTTLPAQHTGYD